MTDTPEQTVIAKGLREFAARQQWKMITENPELKPFIEALARTAHNDALEKAENIEPREVACGYHDCGGSVGNHCTVAGTGKLVHPHIRRWRAAIRALKREA